MSEISCKGWVELQWYILQYVLQYHLSSLIYHDISSCAFCPSLLGRTSEISWGKKIYAAWRGSTEHWYLQRCKVNKISLPDVSFSQGWWPQYILFYLVIRADYMLVASPPFVWDQSIISFSHLRWPQYIQTSCTCFTCLLDPPLKSETGWTEELWLKTNLLNWQN